VRNLTSRWRRPDKKNRTAMITIMNRTAGLILVPDEEEEEEEEGFDSLRKVSTYGGG